MTRQEGEDRPRVVVDRSRCIGSGVCVVADPARFELAEDSRARLRADGGTDDGLHLALRGCPVGAIRLAPEPLGVDSVTAVVAPNDD